METLPENDRTRYTPTARKTRLVQLNHQRVAEEAAAQTTQAQRVKA